MVPQKGVRLQIEVADTRRRSLVVRSARVAGGRGLAGEAGTLTTVRVVVIGAVFVVVWWVGLLAETRDGSTAVVGGEGGGKAG